MGDKVFFYISSIYTRCSTVERLDLWEELKSINIQNLPRTIGGNFNVILNKEEKLGGLEFTQMKVLDFVQCINNCALSEIKFTGSKYTWWNG